MSRMVDIQNASSSAALPTPEQIEQWVNAALDGRRDAAELTVRIVDEPEARDLNSQYRDRDYATNVLSFPVELPEEVGSNLLGDLVICAAVVEREAAEQGKPLDAHWAHLVIHGCLHLLGFNHQQNDEAEQMESLEIRILRKLGFADPYQFQ